MFFFVFFFFSSRRRHTRCSRDWSSDVCSSDLVSNVTEAGFRPDAGFPARLTDLLHTRFVRLREGPSVFVIPTELVEERSEEHTSELQSRLHLVCRLLLEKKKNPNQHRDTVAHE